MLSKFSVKKPYTVLVAVAIVIVLGALSFQNMSTDFLPDMEFPYAIVMTTYAGASPEEVERAVTEPIEQSMSSINNVKKVQSMSINNMSVVIMEFNEGTDMGTTVVDMRESLDMATARWDDGIGSPTIMKLNPDMMPVMVAALDFKDAKTTEGTKKAEQDIIPELESVDGVASVKESGAVEKKVSVILQQDKIDKINKLVQKAIEGKFEDPEKKLADGQQKIRDGKSTLDSKTDSAASQIAKGETKLNGATEKIKTGLDTINSQIAQVKEQQKTLNTSGKQVNSGLATIAANKAKVNASIKTLKTALTGMEQMQRSLAALEKQEAALKTQIEAAGDMATEEMKSGLTSVQAQLKVIRDNLTKQGITEAALPTKIKEMQANLTKAQSGLTELEKNEKTLKANQKKVKAAQKKIKDGLKKLNDAKTKLESGKISTSEAMEQLNKKKILAGIQMSVAKTKLENGEDKMKDAKKTLKDTKKTTKENSDLNKIITK